MQLPILQSVSRQDGAARFPQLKVAMQGFPQYKGGNTIMPALPAAYECKH